MSMHRNPDSIINDMCTDSRLYLSRRSLKIRRHGNKEIQPLVLMRERRGSNDINGQGWTLILRSKATKEPDYHRFLWQESKVFFPHLPYPYILTELMSPHVRCWNLTIHAPIFTSIAIVGIAGTIMDQRWCWGLRFRIHAGRDCDASPKKGGQRLESRRGGGRRRNLLTTVCVHHQVSSDLGT